jgi:RNA polymerase sigma-70 factor (ECF subfamily)
MKLHVTSFIASEGISVLEGRWEGPPDDPFHCPPAMTQVCFWRGESIQRVHLYYAPREQEEGVFSHQGALLTTAEERQ